MRELNIGDLVWQSRLPGGICIYLGEEIVEEGRGGCDDGELYYRVLHPTEGFVFEPAYYYDQLPKKDKDK